MRSTQVDFELGSTDRERPFLREYMVPAWERFAEMEAFESGWFWPHGRHAHYEGTDLEPGGVVFVMNGDPEAVVEAERGRWERLREEGTIEGWSTRSFDPEYENALDKMQDELGPVAGRRNLRLRPIASNLTVDVLAEFDDPLPAVGEPTADNPVPNNFWSVIHFVMKQNGYDWHDEIDACTKATKNRLRSLARFVGDEAARAKLDETLAELEAVADELDEGRPSE